MASKRPGTENRFCHLLGVYLGQVTLTWTYFQQLQNETTDSYPFLRVNKINTCANH